MGDLKADHAKKTVENRTMEHIKSSKIRNILIEVNKKDENNKIKLINSQLALQVHAKYSCSLNTLPFKLTDCRVKLIGEHGINPSFISTSEENGKLVTSFTVTPFSVRVSGVAVT